MSRPKPDSKSAEDYRNHQYETFQLIGSVPSDWRWDGSEPTENRDASGAPAGQCGLCEKEPIAYEYTLVKKADRNTRLIVGSECVHTFIDAEPWTDQRRAKETMKRLMLLNKMANYLVKNPIRSINKASKAGMTYEQAKAEANEMTTDQIARVFSNRAKARSSQRLALRAEALAAFITENKARLWDQNWVYFNRNRTIISSLSYMAVQWRQGRDTPYMNGPMNAALVKLGLELPAAPKLAEETA